MKFTVEKETFLVAVTNAVKSVQQKSSIPVLEGLLMVAENNMVMLTGYDLEIGITTQAEAKIIEEGRSVVSARLLHDICRSANGSVIEFNETPLTMEIRSGTVFYDITTLKAKDYPELPKPDAQPAFSMLGGTLKQLVELTIFAIAQDDINPANTGELFELTHDRLTIVALDGFRLAICRRPVISNTEIRIVIPGKTMQELARLITDPDKSVEVSVSNRYIVFSGENFTLVSRLIHSEYLDYNRVIPTGEKTFIRVNVKEFISCIDRTALVIKERIKNPLRITFDHEGIHLVCQTSLGKVTDDMECGFSGEVMEIGFNNRYLQDALKATNCEYVRIELISDLRAIKIYPDEGDDFLFLVLPVRLKPSEKQSQEQEEDTQQTPTGEYYDGDYSQDTSNGDYPNDYPDYSEQE